VTNLIYPGGKNVYYGYDSNNHLTNVTDWAQRKTSMAFDLAGRVTTITRPNGSYRTIGYDAGGQATNIMEQMSNSLPVAIFKFNWTNSGSMAWEFAAPLPHVATVPTRTMTYDDDNRLATFNGSPVTSDSDGNLTSAPLTNGTFASYAYDARNRLLNAAGVTNLYDTMDNRIGQTLGTNTTVYVMNPNAKLPQVLMRIKNGVTNYYIYGAGLLYQITETATATNTLTYHYDYRGSTIALSADNGVITDRIEYSAYGLTTYHVGMTDTPFLFNGRFGVQTDANGLLYMRARYYNPYLCRFINPDPTGFAGGMNFYAYANGNPVSYLDPFGLSAIGDYFSGVGQVFAGYGLAVRDTAVGLYNVGRHPVNTAVGLYNVVTSPVQAYNAISQSVVNTWNSGLTGQGEIVGNILIAAASMGATKATSVAGQAGEAGDLVAVSRWGRPGLEAGDWVMNGPKTFDNYLLSGKWDTLPFNKYVPFDADWAGGEFSVPASDVYWPRGLGLDGRVKGLFGQRIYAPDGMGLLSGDEAAAFTAVTASGFYHNNSSTGK
jgi:RHS repeat-associated protein